MSIEHGLQLPPSARVVRAAGEISTISLQDEIGDMSAARRKQFHAGLKEMDDAQQSLDADLGVYL